MRGVRRRSLWKQRAVSVKDKMSARTPSVPTAGIMGASNEMMKEAERMRRRVILPCWRSERGLTEKLKRSDWCPPPTPFTRGVSTWWKRNVYITPKQQTTYVDVWADKIVSRPQVKEQKPTLRRVYKYSPGLYLLRYEVVMCQNVEFFWFLRKRVASVDREHR